MENKLQREIQTAQKKFIYFVLNLSQMCHNYLTYLKKYAGFQLMIEKNNVFHAPFLNDGIDLYEDMFRKKINLYFAYIAPDYSLH